MRYNWFAGGILLLMAGGCHERVEFKDTARDNFRCLWQTVADHYCFFAEKDIDWNEVGTRYEARIHDGMRWDELYMVCSQMLDELEDGHVNLITPFSTSYYRKWWTAYPQDFDWRTVQEYYLNFNYLQTSGVCYSMVSENVGYIYYPSFSTTVGEGNLDYILAILGDCKGLIIDIRDNGGGLLTNIDRFVSRFIDEPVTGAYLRHKTGPGPDEFSAPYPIVYEPADEGRVKYGGRIAVLTNRSCFSAANSFVAVMKELPQVTVVGARTGGGGGMPFTAELPNGWAVRFSACPINDRFDRTTEFGIDPSEGCEVHAPAEELAAGRDAILDFAIELLEGVEDPS